ncbi:hypothetical protein MRX96_034283 [Rhipicephalus microplus]
MAAEASGDGLSGDSVVPSAAGAGRVLSTPWGEVAGKGSPSVWGEGGQGFTGADRSSVEAVVGRWQVPAPSKLAESVPPVVADDVMSAVVDATSESTVVLHSLPDIFSEPLRSV